MAYLRKKNKNDIDVKDGRVIQTLQAHAGTFLGAGNWNQTSTTWNHTGMTLGITPKEANSTIYGSGYVSCGSDVTGTSAPMWSFKMLRSDADDNDDTDVTITANRDAASYYGHMPTSLRYDFYVFFPMWIRDTAHKGPGVTTNYRLYFRAGTNSYAVRGGNLEMTYWEVL